MALVSLGMAGCLKDKDYDDGKIQSTTPGGNQNIVEMRISANNTKNFVSLAYSNSNNDTTVNLVPITLVTGNAPEDIHVTLDLKPDLVKVYNDSNGTQFDVPTTSLVTIVSNVVTIPKGSNTGYLQVKFKPSNLIGLELAYGFAISSVDKPNYVISGNLGSGVVAILIKNKYDGIYHATGHFAHPSSPRDIDEEKEEVITASGNSVTKELGDLGSGTKIVITINPDNSVTITPGEGTSGTTAAVGNFIDVTRPEYNNTYDPATKTFMLSYGYPLPAPTRTITEKLVYTGVR